LIIAVAVERRYRRTPDGRIWTIGQMPKGFFERYLGAFEKVRIIARVEEVPHVQDDWERVDGDGIDVFPVAHYVGPEQFFSSLRAVVGSFDRALRDVDSLVIRAPGTIGSLAWAAALRDGVPYGVEVVGDPADVYAPGVEPHPAGPVFRAAFGHLTARQCAGAAAVSYVTEFALQKRYPPAASAFVTHYSSVDLGPGAFVGSARIHHRTDGDRIVIISVGTMEKTYKGFDVLIDASSILAQRGLDFELRLLGDGSYRSSLEKRASVLGIGDRVSFLGEVPSGGPVRQKLDEATLFVLPSLTEGLPRVLIEAMARGLPAVGTRVGGVPELLDDGQLVQAGDAEALADAIHSNLKDRLLMSRLSKRNLDRARDYRHEALSPRRSLFTEHLHDVALKKGRTKIVYVTTHPSAARWFLRGQPAHLKELGFEPVIVSSPGPDLEVVKRREGVRTVIVKMAREMDWPADLWSLFGMLAALARIRPEVVNAGTPKAALLGMLAASVLRVPVRIYTLHGLRLETTSGPRRWLLGALERLTAVFAHRVWCVSPSLKDLYAVQGFAPARKLAVLAGGSANGVDLSRFDSSLRIRAGLRGDLHASFELPPEARVIGFVGRFTRDKGIEDLIAAFETICARVSNAWLLMVGDFEEGDPLPLSAREAMRRHPRIRITGFIDDDRVPEALMAMDVLALPSRREGLSMVALEAGASGIPVVAYRVTGLVDVVSDGETGALIEPGDVDRIAQALQDYLDDEKMARRHGERGLERVTRLFNQKRVWKAIEREYAELLEKKGLHLPIGLRENKRRWGGDASISQPAGTER
jgi:glycosyltransferase involved in cell wall biosynthesis